LEVRHTRTDQPALAANACPSDEKAMLVGWLPADVVSSRRPCDAFQSVTSPLSLAVASTSPFGLNATARTPMPGDTDSVVMRRSSGTVASITVPSALAMATRSSRGENAALRIGLRPATCQACGRTRSTSQTRTCPSLPLVTRREPSAEKATDDAAPALAPRWASGAPVRTSQSTAPPACAVASRRPARATAKSLTSAPAETEPSDAPATDHTWMNWPARAPPPPRTATKRPLESKIAESAAKDRVPSRRLPRPSRALRTSTRPSHLTMAATPLRRATLRRRAPTMRQPTRPDARSRSSTTPLNPSVTRPRPSPVKRASKRKCSPGELMRCSSAPV
jgi:hypothetical protein